jgi:hypothetical protein
LEIDKRHGEGGGAGGNDPGLDTVGCFIEET